MVTCGVLEDEVKVGGIRIVRKSKGGVDLWELFKSSKENISKEPREPSEGGVRGDAPTPLNFVLGLPCQPACLA